MNLIKTSLITSLLVLFLACGSDPAPASASVDIEATVEARVAKAISTAIPPTPTPTPVSVSTKVISSIDGIYDWEKYVISKGLRTGIVKKVEDGDTIVLKSGEIIRYLEVSTREIRNPKECYGDEAKVKNKELVLNQTIYIQPPTEGKSIDKYGRTLAYVFTDKTFVFLELVKNGYAIVERYAAPNEFYDLLKQAEDDARLNNRGLWGKCDSLTPTPVKRATATPTPVQYKELPSWKRSGGNRQYDAKNYSAAIEIYTKVIQSWPSPSPGKLHMHYYFRGKSYKQLQLNQMALNDFTEAIRLNPNDVFSFYERAIIYNELGQYQKALDDFTKATERWGSFKPTGLDAIYAVIYYRHFTYYKLGLYEQSILDLMRYLEFDPNNKMDGHAYAYEHLGYSRYKSEQYQEAIDSFNKALELDPSKEDNLRVWINDAKAELNK